MEETKEEETPLIEKSDDVIIEKEAKTNETVTMIDETPKQEEVPQPKKRPSRAKA